jgi:hypothetical protein
VFVNHVTDVLGQDLLRRRFKRALTAASLPALRLYDLRHSFGTLAVQVLPLTDVKAVDGPRERRHDDDLRAPRPAARVADEHGSV